MIEAPCAACGTVNRIMEADVPAGAKFVTCSSCKSRVALPVAKPAAGAAKPPALPTMPLPKGPPPKPPATPSKPGAFDLADLPAPKRTSPLAMVDGPAKPAPKSALDSRDDLPAPYASKKAEIADLPAPKTRVPVKPVPPIPVVAPPVPTKQGITDLPTPKPPAGIVDLPTPKHPGGIIDLPAPKVGKPMAADPPAPKVTRPIAVEPPAPKAAPGGPQDIIDLPTPKPGGTDLPAPKGFFDDLPQPARNQGPDLPAPKGFFDDLPQPARNQGPNLPAPKGFFDDLPQPAKQQPPELPAPKGFFDDLPQPAKQQPPELPAPKGFFDDLADPAAPVPASPSSAGSDLELASDLGQPLELDSGPALDLGAPGAENASDGFADLDLREPETSSSAIKITTPKPGKAPDARPIAAAPVPAKAVAAAARGEPKGELKLELEGEQPALPGASAAKQATTKLAKEVKPAEPAGKRSRGLLGGLLGIVLLGGGGFYFYQRHEKQKQAEEEVGEHLASARRALIAPESAHWTRASNDVREVLELDPQNAAALGIGAEAAIAGALDNGVAMQARLAQGNKMIADALEAGRTGPELDRAQAVAAVASNQPDHAIPRLQALIAKAPKDGFLQLYLGWAQYAKGDATAAIKSFDDAVAANPAVKLPALYARGRAKLLQADMKGARDDFAAVLELAKDHVGAQVGLAATLPPAQSLQREQDLLAILARKDIATADTRAVVLAWTLAGDVARVAGRLDVARERYKKAIAITQLDVGALTGLARTEMRDGKLEVAKDLLAKATTQAKDDPIVKIANAELAIRQGRLPDALAILKELDARTPPIAPLQHAQLQLVKGKLLEAQGADDDAVDAYEQGAKDAGELDLSPTMAAVEKLTALAKKASDNKDDKKAAAYRERSDQLLSALAERAREDAQLSMTLGVAYLQAGDPGKAEGLLRRATEMRPTDIESKLQLAKALGQLGRAEDALAQLNAALDLDKNRADIALELARTYEAAGRDNEAEKAYDVLVAAKDVAIPARAHAGRFYARRGEIEKAAAQGDKILAAEVDNPAGHYLKGEGLIKAGKLDDARRELQIATGGDPDPQYLDAQGRAAEASVVASGDTKYYDLALRAYQRATEADPKRVNSFAGQGRVYVARREWDKAVAPLQSAFALDPKNADVMYMLGLVAKNLHQNKVAIEWIEKSVRIKPLAEAYFVLGGLYFDTNDPPKSADRYARATQLGDELERQGTKVDWLTEAYYWAGRVPMDMHDERRAAGPWRIYVTRKPPENTHTKEVRSALATTLKPF